MKTDVIKKQLSLPNSTRASTLGLHTNSQAISKVKPIIRIFHVFPPEIIKTDVQNFRELVQRLTGKPIESCKTLKRRKIIPRKEMAVQAKMELINGLNSKEFKERTKGEEEIWRGANSGGSFLGNFGELGDGDFMEELNGFPFFPLDSSSHMDTYEEPQLA